MLSDFQCRALNLRETLASVQNNENKLNDGGKGIEFGRLSRVSLKKSGIFSN